MDFKRLSQTLLFQVIVAIILGIACSFFFPQWLARVFITYNGLFNNFLGFFVPVLILALITPAIAGLGRGAGKWLAVTSGIAYASTVMSGLFAYSVARSFYPTLLGGQSLNSNVSNIDDGALKPFFEVKMPPPMDIMSALLLAFCVGVAMTTVKSDTLYGAARELENVVMKVIESFILPQFPVFIFGMFLGLGMNGNIGSTLAAFGKVLVLAIAMTVLLLFLQFFVASGFTGKNPFKALMNMAPAYFTALGTSSSAATIPVTYKATLSNGVEKNVAGFVIPLCATIHLSGSMMKITLFSFAIVYMAHLNVTVGLAVGFILMLGITMIAAPGVPGGAIMAAVGLLGSMLHFDDQMVALMIAAYIAIDSFGTAANVTGDGAIALIVERFARGKISDRQAEGSFERAEDNLDTNI